MIAGVIGTTAIVAVFIVVGLIVDRKYGVMLRPDRLATPRTTAQHGVGEAPAMAIRAGAAQRATLRESQRCPSCRGPMTNDVDDTVRYNQRQLLVLHFHCSKCATKRSLYVEELA